MAKTPESKKTKPKKAPANTASANTAPANTAPVKTAASEESARKVVARQRGLGRGLSSLLGDAAVSVSSSDASAGTAEQPAAALPAAQLTGLVDIPIEWINSGPWQPRRRFDIAALEELADSIRSKGLVQPVLVRAHATVAGTAAAGEVQAQPLRLRR